MDIPGMQPSPEATVNLAAWPPPDRANQQLRPRVATRRRRARHRRARRAPSDSGTPDRRTSYCGVNELGLRLYDWAQATQASMARVAASAT